MEIRRDKYLNDLIDRMHNGLIKVVTGIRRSGKSYLLFHIFKNYLLESGIERSHIIELELDQRKNRQYRDPDVILEYIESKIADDGEKYYILLDEVQMLQDFEEVLNSLLHIDYADIYVTGGNSKFLSKDIITEFRGRGDEVHVYPLTFKEFMQVFDGDIYQGWAEYVVYGGLPLVTTMKKESQKIQYLESLFEESYIKDIIEHNHIERTQELGDLINVLASAVGSLTNPSKIAATFQSEIQSGISQNTIRQYIEYLKDAFVISEVNRYDVKGRKYIGTPLKYYFEDIGLRNVRLGFRQVEETHLMENVIYNELRYRGFQVDVGVVPIRKKNAQDQLQRIQLEIDFVANLGSKRYYIQSTLRIGDSDKENQEKASFMNVGDSFKKIVIVKDVMKVARDENGITTMSLYDFLMQDNSLEL